MLFDSCEESNVELMSPSRDRMDDGIGMDNAVNDATDDGIGMDDVMGDVVDDDVISVDNDTISHRPWKYNDGVPTLLDRESRHALINYLVDQFIQAGSPAINDWLYESGVMKKLQIHVAGGRRMFDVMTDCPDSTTSPVQLSAKSLIPEAQ